MKQQLIVKKLEKKILSNPCLECDCENGCEKEKMKKSIENKISILDGNKTVLK